MSNGAQVMVKALETAGARVVFGYPGAAVCPFVDALASSQLDVRLVRHEQSAGHAASGWARVTGQPGVCFATSGPGATNLITALATAYMDSIPLVAVTGQVQSSLIGRDVFQEADITGSAEPFCKHSYLVRAADELPRVMQEAFYIASTGRPGPVLVDVPVDVQTAEVAHPAPPAAPYIRGYHPTADAAVDEGQIARLAAALQKAQRPVICAGGGVRSAGACAALAALALRLHIPVVATLMGLDALPAAHPLFYGMLGTHGCRAANRAVHEADLLLIAGARVGDRAMASPEQFAARATVAHIDIDPAEIGKNIGVDIAVAGDVRAAFERLDAAAAPGDTAAWVRTLDALRAAPAPAAVTPPGFLNPRAFFETLSAAAAENAVLVADVGQSQIWAANHYAVRAGRFLTTGGMGTMGYALPAAVGASLAQPDRQVIAVCGDGAFHMSMMELASVRQFALPLKLVVMQNGCLGMVHEIQTKKYGKRYTATEIGAGNPDFGLLARAYGMGYARLSRTEDAPAAVARMLETPGAYLLACDVWPDEPTLG